MRTADLLVIGGGPGGYETAAAAAARGEKVILFERDRLGGTCLNRGCIPTKCLCASAKLLDDIRHASALGISTSGTTVDFTAIKQRISEVTDTLRQDIAGALGDVEIVNAEATIGPGPSVVAAAETYTAPSIIIATGSAPAHLRIPGAETALDSDAVLALDAVPESMVIIGGGVIGLEFASVLNSFGCNITVLEYCKEILPGFDRDIAKRLRGYLSRKGIDIVTGAEVTAIENGCRVPYLCKGKEKQVEAATILTAVGRRPVLPSGLENAGVSLNARGFIDTDSEFRAAPGIYAIGDVNGRCMLAHAASAQGRVVLGHDVRLDIMPGVVFSNPECAMVGITEETATASGRECIAVKVPYGANGKAIASGESDGLLKLIVNKGDGTIAGCHCVGEHAADIVAEATIAMNSSMSVGTLAHGTVHAHPTLSELLATAATAAAARL